MRRLIPGLILAGAGLWAGAAGGQGSAPVGPEFQVNTYTTSLQIFAGVALGPGGRFVVVWQSQGSGGSDSDNSSILAQRYAADGSALGQEFQVNTFTTSFQRFPTVAMGAGGQFVVVWDNQAPSGSDSDGYSIQAQRYAADGSALGQEFQVNSFVTADQRFPVVSVGPGGQFVVVWHSEGSDGPDNDGLSIQAQRYAADGSPLGQEFQVNTFATSNQRAPWVAMGPGGQFVVVWHSTGSDGPDNDGFSVQAQRYAADGSPLGQEFQVNTFTTAHQRYSTVAIGPSDQFAVVWHSDGSGGSDSSQASIQAQRYAADGSPLGQEFQVNTYTTAQQISPVVSFGPAGQFLVVWESQGSAGSDNSPFSIQAQRYAADGSPVGQEVLQVNTYTTLSQRLPAMSMGPEGQFVVAWGSDGSSGSDNPSYSIQAQRYEPSLDLSLQKLDAPDPVDAGGLLSYGLTVVYPDGPLPARDVVLSDTLPSAVSVRSLASSQGACGVTPGPLNETVTCQLGVLQPGGSVQVLLTVAVDASATGPLQNTAQLSLANPDSDPNDNTASQQTEVNTATATPSPTPSLTTTPVPSSTPPPSPTPSLTTTPVPSSTPPPSPTPSLTTTPVPSSTPPPSSTPSLTTTPVPSSTPPPTRTATATASPSVTPSSPPADADGDGVIDVLDQCADTPPGSFVDSRGCPGNKMQVANHWGALLLLSATLAALYALVRRSRQ